MRSIALLSLLLPLGASRVASRSRAGLIGVFLTASAINALVAVLQSRGLFRPFALETFGGRQDTGAYAGNVGYLAITLALASVLALGVALEARRPLVRILAGAALPLYAATLVVNQNLTALTALLSGVAILLVLRFRARAALPLAAAVAAVAVASPPTRRSRIARGARARREQPELGRARVVSRGALGGGDRDDAPAPLDGIRPGNVRRRVRPAPARRRDADRRRLVGPRSPALTRKRTATTCRPSATPGSRPGSSRFGGRLPGCGDRRLGLAPPRAGGHRACRPSGHGRRRRPDLVPAAAADHGRAPPARGGPRLESSGDPSRPGDSP